MKTIALGSAAVLAIAAGLFQQPGPPEAEFAYDRSKPFDMKVEKQNRRGEVTVLDVTYSGLDGKRNAAFLVEPSRPARRPGVLFVHWLEDGHPTSNRTEFLEESVELAASAGVVSLLPNAMWSVPKWFSTREPASDYAMSIAQVNELRRALDLLASRSGVDADRLLFVGHDFGAMYGAIAAGLDPTRVRAFVFMAGTRSFSDWFLLYPKVSGEARQLVIDRLAPLDPTRYLAKLGSIPVLFQFATRDRFVSKAAADALVGSAAGPKEVHFYESDHSLASPAAVRADRMAWLKAQMAGGR